MSDEVEKVEVAEEAQPEPSVLDVAPAPIEVPISKEKGWYDNSRQRIYMVAKDLYVQYKAAHPADAVVMAVVNRFKDGVKFDGEPHSYERAAYSWFMGEGGLDGADPATESDRSRIVNDVVRFGNRALGLDVPKKEKPKKEPKPKKEKKAKAKKKVAEEPQPAPDSIAAEEAAVKLSVSKPRGSKLRAVPKPTGKIGGGRKAKEVTDDFAEKLAGKTADEVLLEQDQLPDNPKWRMAALSAAKMAEAGKGEWRFHAHMNTSIEWLSPDGAEILSEGVYGQSVRKAS